MPGSFGATPADDGLVASTASSSRSGAFARNDGVEEPPPGTPGGAGIFGLTVVPGAAGIFGANNHDSKGRGVQGNGPEAGVSGFSQKGSGLLAHSQEGDGTQSFAHSKDHNGLLAMNDSSGKVTPGEGPVGCGVVGITKVEGAAGVFGANNHPLMGRGVQGNGAEVGVSGFSEKGAGLLAHSNSGDALQAFAHDSKRNGILGHNNDGRNRASLGGPPTGNGVFGYTDVPNGSGVFGAVAQKNLEGAGVTGVGPVAGRFFGNVLVSGELNVAGVLISSLLGRIVRLEQQVAALPGQGGVSTPSKPTISVAQASGGRLPGFLVKGSGFKRSARVTIRIVSSQGQFMTEHGTKPDGTFEANQTISCDGGDKLNFSATDGSSDPSDLTGTLWSNTFPISCPMT